MMFVELNRDDWNQIMTIIGNTRDFSWSVTNPLLMKIGQQLQSQETNNKQASAEMPINIGEVGGVKQ